MWVGFLELLTFALLIGFGVIQSVQNDDMANTLLFVAILLVALFLEYILAKRLLGSPVLAHLDAEHIAFFSKLMV